MTHEKFRTEIDTLKKFFEVYCHDKHQDRTMYEGNYKIPYKDEYFKLDIHLCDDCNALLSNSITKLQECPHEEKPRCRKCPNPCYDRDEWRAIAKVMKYSGMKLGVSKVKDKLKKMIGFK